MRLISLTLAADTFSNRAVSRTPRPSSNACRIRCTVNGVVLGKSTFRGTPTQDVSVFVEGRLKFNSRSILLRLEGFNLFNHANLLGRAQTNYGDLTTVNNTFGQLVAVGTTSNALPALANIDPPRFFQFQVRFGF